MASRDQGRAKQIAHTAKLLRKKAGLSQPQAASAAGVSVDSFREFEQGQRVKVDPALLEKLGRVYGYPFQTFFEEFQKLADVPAPDPELRRHIWLSVAPGAPFTAEQLAEIQAYLDKQEANAIAELRKRKLKRKD